MEMILFSAKIASKYQERLKANFPNQVFTFCESNDEIKQHVSDAAVIVTYGEDLTAELIGQANSLKWIMVISAGVDKLPFQAIRKKGILVTNARGIHKIPMAEYAISMLLQVYRQEKVIMQNQAEKVWDKSVRMKEITGKTMLIAGTGAIGQEVARLAKAFHMKTIGVSRSGSDVTFFDENHSTDDMNGLLPHADFIITVLPNTKETQGLFTYEHFQNMPNHAVFVNMGRGNIVSSTDLLKAIREKEIAHAVLDVFEEEPLPTEHAFWQEENITITPHISGVSPNYVPRAMEIFEHNLQVYLDERDTYVNIIDVTRGY